MIGAPLNPMLLSINSQNWGGESKGSYKTFVVFGIHKLNFTINFVMLLYLCALKGCNNFGCEGSAQTENQHKYLLFT